MTTKTRALLLIWAALQSHTSTWPIKPACNLLVSCSGHRYPKPHENQSSTGLQAAAEPKTFQGICSTRRSSRPRTRSPQNTNSPPKHCFKDNKLCADSKGHQELLTYRLGVKSSNNLRAGHGLQPVLQCLQVHTLLWVIWRVHQHSQAALHARQLGWNQGHVLPAGKGSLLPRVTSDSISTRDAFHSHFKIRFLNTASWKAGGTQTSVFSIQTQIQYLPVF